MFIVFEGGECVGKTTQVNLLSGFLRLEGHDVVASREPGGTSLGSLLRTLVLEDEMDPWTEALLLSADRSHHVNSVIRPNIDSGAIVISDRFVGSFVAYQGMARGLDLGRLNQLSEIATGGLVPHVTFLLDGDPELLMSRRKETDRIGSLPLAFHQLVRQGFLHQAKEHGWVVIDATQDPLTVHSIVCGEIARWT